MALHMSTVLSRMSTVLLIKCKKVKELSQTALVMNHSISRRSPPHTHI